MWTWIDLEPIYPTSTQVRAQQVHDGEGNAQWHSHTERSYQFKLRSLDPGHSGRFSINAFIQCAFSAHSVYSLVIVFLGVRMAQLHLAQHDTAWRSLGTFGHSARNEANRCTRQENDQVPAGGRMKHRKHLDMKPMKPSPSSGMRGKVL